MSKSEHARLDFYKEKSVLITGGGTLGREIVKLLLEKGTKEIRIFDNAEQQLFKCELDFQNDPRVSYLLGDVCDLDAINMALPGVDVIIHTAACKFVNYIEYHPFKAIRTNVDGIINIIKAVINSYSVKKAVNISSDKACNPVSIYGYTKGLGERFFTWADRVSPKAFCSVRFPNFYGSDGSVIDTWGRQGKAGLPITVTDKRMMRYFIGIREAAELTLDSLEFSEGGEIFVPADLAERSIMEIAEEFSERYGVPIRLTGKRLGERLREPLMTEIEYDMATQEGKFWRIDPKKEFIGTPHYLYNAYREK